MKSAGKRAPEKASQRICKVMISKNGSKVEGASLPLGKDAGKHNHVEKPVTKKPAVNVLCKRAHENTSEIICKLMVSKNGSKVEVASPPLGKDAGKQSRIEKSVTKKAVVKVVSGLTKEQCKEKKQLLLQIMQEPKGKRLDHSNEPPPELLKVCSDFGGLEGAILALKRIKVNFVHLSSSDTKPACQSWIMALSPGCNVAGNAIGRSPSQVPPHHIYTACWPCQPYCHGGKCEGSEDSKGRGAVAVTSSLKVIRKHRPIVILGEQPIGILNVKHLKFFKGMIECLRGLGYYVFVSVVNLQAYVAQRRTRVYIACIKHGHHKRRFTFPKRQGSMKASQTWAKLMVQGKAPCLLPKHARKRANICKALSKVSSLQAQKKFRSQ